MQGVLKKNEKGHFQRLKTTINNVTALSKLGYSKPLQIHVDSSNSIICCCLIEVNNEGNSKPIAFCSQKLRVLRKSRLYLKKKKAYALIFALGIFENWLHGSSVDIIPEHNPLKCLVERAHKSPNSNLLNKSQVVTSFRVIELYTISSLRDQSSRDTCSFSF